MTLISFSCTFLSLCFLTLWVTHCTGGSRVTCNGHAICAPFKNQMKSLWHPGTATVHFFGQRSRDAPKAQGKVLIFNYFFKNKVTRSEYWDKSMEGNRQKILDLTLEIRSTHNTSIQIQLSKEISISPNSAVSKYVLQD